MIALQYLVVLLLFAVFPSWAQDLSVYGIVSLWSNAYTPSEISSIQRHCFEGLGFITCKQHVTTDPNEYVYLMPAYTGYIRGAPYCLQCCGTNPNQYDTWNFSCSVDFTTSSTSNIYGYEFRFARNRFDGDKAVASCRLERSGCQLYDGGGGIVDNCTLTFLTGYTLTLEVIEYNANFKYWNGIDSCTVTAHESSKHMRIGETFQEIIIIHRSQDLNLVDGTKLLTLLVLLLLFTYFPLHYCRRKNCIVCAKKLVFGYERCYMCVFVGAHPPDPRMLRALEEKSLFIQDEPPERFPGAKAFVAFMRLFWKIGFYACCPRKTAPIVPDATVDERQNSDTPDEVQSTKNNRSDAPQSPVKKKRWFTKSPEKNPNILPYPDHIIYAAVAHHNPPPSPTTLRNSGKVGESYALKY